MWTPVLGLVGLLLGILLAFRSRLTIARSSAAKVALGLLAGIVIGVALIASQEGVALTGWFGDAVPTPVFSWWLHRQETLTPNSVPSEAGHLVKSEQEWQALLTPEQFYVTRRRGTERAFTGKYATTKADGVYHCICCNQPLFDSSTKYESGTGWPSFWKPIDEDHISLVADHSGWMRRTEVTCRRCDAHLGHVFTDGPRPTGLRYCLNSAALNLVER